MYAAYLLIRDMPKEIKDSVLIHEWIHGVLDNAGMGEYSNDEKTCLCFTERVVQTWI